MSIAIVTDSNSGIFEAEAEKLGVFTLPMPVIIDGMTYYEGKSITPEQFYQRLQSGCRVSTSQPAPGDVTALWDRIFQLGYDQILYIPMSSGLSSSCQMAQVLAQDYEGRVCVADCHTISVTQRFSVLDAITLAKAGVQWKRSAGSWSTPARNLSSIWVWRHWSTSSGEEESPPQPLPSERS